MAAISAALMVLCVLPLTYYIEASNALPYQLVCIGLLLSLTYRQQLTNPMLLSIASIALIVASQFDATALTTSPITASFAVIGATIMSKPIRDGQCRHYQSARLFILIVLAFTAINNAVFLQETAGNIRSKGFGSGTIYSLMSVYCVAFLHCLHRTKTISSFAFYGCSSIFLWTLLLTQSRGAIVTLCAALLISTASKTRRTRWSGIVILSIASLALLTNTDIAARFNVHEFSNIDAYSSGRIFTQRLIINELVNGTDYTALVGGFGLNALKATINRLAIEFPHMDILYLAYDGGAILIAIYFALLACAYRTFTHKVMFWAYAISGLHTNMLLSPGFFVLGKIFDTAITEKTPLQPTNQAASGRPALD